MMSSIQSVSQDQGITLRQAALVAGFSLLLTVAAAPVAQFAVFPKLIVNGDIVQTTQNLLTRNGFFLFGIFCYLLTFICDLVISWALYVLLVPVNRALSLLTAWFRLVYTVIALFALAKLGAAYRLVNTSDYLELVGADQLHAQVAYLVKSFRYDWYLGFIFFFIHLVLLGYLVYRSGYIPHIMGVLLAMTGLGYLIDVLRPYLYPQTNVGWVMILFFGEIIFMLWLLIRGWKISHPDIRAAPGEPEAAVT